MNIMNLLKLSLCVVAASLLGGCATSNHATFVESTYAEPAEKSDNEVIGKVTGESKQTWLLYVLPMGEGPSTDVAISDAHAQIDGTKFLSNVSIDDSMYWKIGYKEQVIRVQATAHK